MSEPLPPPDTRVLELLRDEKPAPADARVRARARLGLAVPSLGTSGRHADAPRPGGDAGGGSGATAGAARATGMLGAHGVAVMTFVLGGAAGAGLHAALTSPPPPRIVYVASPTPPVPEPPSTPSPPPPLPTIPVAPSVVASATPVIPPAPTSHLSQLSGERSLLDDIRASLLRGDPGVAIDRLRVSRREFPHAILAEERDALTVEALVGVGRYDEARVTADAFRKRFPGSLFSGAVDSAVRSIP